jgi:hypothetical protein
MAAQCCSASGRGSLLFASTVFVLFAIARASSPQFDSFTIQPEDRLVNKLGVKLTFSFRPSSASTKLREGDVVNLNYVDNFFQAAFFNAAIESNAPSGCVFQVVSSYPTHQRVILVLERSGTSACAGYSGTTAATITVTGLKTGTGAKAPGDIKLKTTLDSTEIILDLCVTQGKCMGHLGNKVLNPTFTMDSNHRFEFRTASAATLTFKTSPGGGPLCSSSQTGSSGSVVLPGRITLHFPSGFFSSTATPTVAIDNSAAATSAAPTLTSIVLNITSGCVPHNTDIAVTLSGLTMGPAMHSVPDGISITTSHDIRPQPHNNGIGRHQC